jgi:alanyl-tRNA synthetase
MLYYEDATKAEFEATVVAHINGGVALDQTCFYPEGGGQEWDLGLLNGIRVCKVIKAKTCILHYLDGMLPPVGTKVRGYIDMDRRLQLMRHHTAAHVINGSARRLFGNHVWQAGAHKSVEEGRLDITHYENLSTQQRDELERECNRVVLADFPINITFMQRDVAESKHGYRLYQGGAVPGKVIRVVDIVGFDTEACGGLHCTHTGMIGPIRLRKTKRIQDGIVRVEYTAGMAAIREFQRDKDVIEESAETLNVTLEKVNEGILRLQDENKAARKQLESLGAQMNELKAAALLSSAIRVGEARLIVHIVGDEDPEELSKRLVSEKKVVAVIGKKGASCKVLVSRSPDLEVDCRPLLKEVMSLMGGGGGGRKEYAQGGGGSAEKMDDAFAQAEALVRKAIKN